MVCYYNSSTQKGHTGRQSTLRLSLATWRDPVYKKFKQNKITTELHMDVDPEVEDFEHM